MLKTFKETTKILIWLHTLLPKEQKRYLIITYICDILSIFKDLIQLLIIGNVLTKLSLNITNLNLYSFLPEFYLFAGTRIVFAIIEYISKYYSTKYLLHLDYYAQTFIIQHLNKLPIAYLEDPIFSNRLTLAQENIGSLYDYISLTKNGVVNIIAIIIYLFGINLINPIFIPIIIIVRLAETYVLNKYNKKAWEYNKKTTETRRIRSNLESNLTTAKTFEEIKISNISNYLLDKIIRIQEDRFQTYFGIRTTQAKYNLLSNLANLTWQVGAIFFLINQVLNKIIPLGQLMVQYNILNQFGAKIAELSGFMSWVSNTSFKIKEIQEFFEYKPLSQIETKKIETKTPQLLNFQKLSFAYPTNKEKIILKDITFQINPGEKIAIVGANGAGKTTLIKLISKFYTVDEALGELTVDGNPINTINTEDWFNNIGIVMQDYNKYEFLSVAENIMLGDPQKNDYEYMKLCAEQADCVSFIESFPNKYETVLSSSYKNGANLSTGQWQKIALARFFYRNPNIIIFDEPTSSIDAISEEKIFNNIYNFFEGKTVIIISHRFSTVKKADKIYVLDQGSIVEKGSHSELLAMDGLYAKSYHLQTEK